MKLITQSLIFAALIATLAHAAESPPKIEFDRTVYDFGTTSRVQSVEGVFKIRNGGGSPLEIAGLGGSCVCTRAAVEQSTLQPGESCALSFSMNIGPSEGDIVEQIYVPSNDPQKPKVTLTLKLRIPLTFEVTPAEIRLANLPPGARTNIVLRVNRTDGRRLRITKVEADPKTIRTTIEPVTNSTNQSAQVTITITAPTTAGSFARPIRFHTGERYPGGIPKPSFEVPLTGHVVETLR